MVEGAVVERQGLGGARVPADPRLGSAGDGEHALVRIDGDDLTVRTDAPMCSVGDDAGSAADVEHPVAGADVGMVEDRLGELPEQGRHEEGVVDLGGVGVHLPPLGVGHGRRGVLRHDASVQSHVHQLKF